MKYVINKYVKLFITIETKIRITFYKSPAAAPWRTSDTGRRHVSGPPHVCDIDVIIYIYIYREREILERDIACTYVYTYIYIYI